MSEEARLAVSTAIGHAFADVAWLDEALTHPSYSEEQGGQVPHNQRLEFLGDAVVGLAVAAALHGRFAEADEGGMSRVRSRLVSAASLAQAARQAGLGEWLRLGRGETLSDGGGRQSNLADVFEAVVGAVFCDAGYAVAERVVLRLLGDSLADARVEAPRTDHKTALQEWTQARSGRRPEYRVVATRGPAHALAFDVEVCIDGRSVAEATGSSKKEAQQQAAARALEALTSGADAIKDPGAPVSPGAPHVSGD